MTGLRSTKRDQISWWRIKLRQARFWLFKLSRQLTPRQIAALFFTHMIVYPLEHVTFQVVRMIYGKMPREFTPPQYDAVIISAVGFAQRTEHALWMALWQRFVRQRRVLVMETPRQGNVNGMGAEAFFYGIARRNVTWLAEALRADVAAGKPIILIGFSKGGLDGTILQHLLWSEHGIRIPDIVTLSTPWQGSRLWRFSGHLGSEHFKPGNKSLQDIEELAQRQRQELGIRFRFFASTHLDVIVHHSDARFRRPAEDHGLSLEQLRVRWYYAQSLWLQVGHTALFNPIVFLQMDNVIEQCIQAQTRG